jgi:hypothetical protein
MPFNRAYRELPESRRQFVHFLGFEEARNSAEAHSRRLAAIWGEIIHCGYGAGLGLTSFFLPRLEKSHAVSEVFQNFLCSVNRAFAHVTYDAKEFRYFSIQGITKLDPGKPR